MQGNFALYGVDGLTHSERVRQALRVTPLPNSRSNRLLVLSSSQLRAAPGAAVNFVDQMMAVEAYENGGCTAYDRFVFQTAWRNSKTSSCTLRRRPPYLSSPIDPA